ncbi:hypothetical protein [Halobacillus sp. B23F22_1]|uniref:hypothetical protein n=1 Tax=Halobacillus sp. B23F22_1 TaxID=3459514 RepID=UPI00373F1C67
MKNKLWQFFKNPLISPKIDRFLIIPGIIIGVIVSKYGSSWGLSIVEELLLLVGILFVYIVLTGAGGRWWRRKKEKYHERK